VTPKARLTGVFLVDKPEGLTSFGVVSIVRRSSGARRCGHTGTLDPFATGLLLVCVGGATRLARFLGEGLKTYRAVVRFGWGTDTYDRTGRPVGEPVEIPVEADAIRPLLDGFLGVQLQVPPPFSAKKRDGERLYRLARQGKPVIAEPVPVYFEAVRLERVDGSRAEIELTVGSGTYVRSFAHELGIRAGTGAHLESLRRTRIGSFRVEDALGLDALERLRDEGRLSDALLAPVDALPDLPLLTLTGDDAIRARHGQSLPAPGGARPGQNYRLVDPTGALVAVAVASESGVRPAVVLA